MTSLLAEITIWTLILCVLAAFVAGFVDAVAGGGGLVQLPVLLWAFPLSPLANVLGTNKAVSLVGTTAAATTYRRRIAINTRVLVPMMATAFIGSLVGAVLATRVEREWFEPIILTILICVGLVTIFRPEFGKSELQLRSNSPIAAPLLCLGIGFYDGLIGPGTGMFLVFGLVGLIGNSFLSASALAKFINIATNLAALAIFIPGGHVMWLVAGLMAPANLLGGYVGAHTAINRGSVFVRVIFLIMLVVLIGRLVATI